MTKSSACIHNTCIYIAISMLNQHLLKIYVLDTDAHGSNIAHIEEYNNLNRIMKALIT